MKKISILFSMLFVILTACKKEEEDDTFQPPPYSISIQFGHFNSFDFLPYKNQNTVPLDTITGYTDFVITLTEKNIPDIKNKNTDTLVFNFNVSTNEDEETFNGTGLESSTTFSYSNTRNEIEGSFSIPYSINPVAIKNNGVLEIKSPEDNISVDFTSHYTANRTNKTLTIE
jgi:hypothetical protein